MWSLDQHWKQGRLGLWIGPRIGGWGMGLLWAGMSTSIGFSLISAALATVAIASVSEMMALTNLASWVLRLLVFWEMSPSWKIVFWECWRQMDWRGWWLVMREVEQGPTNIMRGKRWNLLMLPWLVEFLGLQQWIGYSPCQRVVAGLEWQGMEQRTIMVGWEWRHCWSRGVNQLLTFLDRGEWELGRLPS